MDIAFLIQEYLKDKQDLRDVENDSINIVDNQIIDWRFANIPCPTQEQLEALIPSVQANIDQNKANAEALKYLADTDWMVIRALEDSSKPVPADIVALRAEARLKVIK